ncbi:ErfK/YbiS/YcfS/YnhG family protein [Beijerinckiaceae bacterium RH AL1]|nr:ErfK/YbiS/YcfS/YnhG family protein [Beijerinckiaceae bacterium RH CH11]VVB49570.1 ErfK/YbiS/YcfS/YnhG family protein [Beijerinckiaceae bacterium RH AL8]VVC56929.1 ErfK/YbiS/YcfS/YnhG family protein [Beijerinckiaceae bacterium RH AL1]
MNDAPLSSSLRRRLAGAIALAAVAATLAGCGPDGPQLALNAPPPPAAATPKPVQTAALDPRFSALYQPMKDKFEVPGVPKSVVRKGFDRVEVDYATVEKPGTVVVDPHAHYLYFVEPNGKAMRYGVAVGKAGFVWSGEAYIKTKQEWPDWYPPKEMIDRHPELKAQLDKLQSGMGVAGGYRNPLGARAMYLWQGNKDTYFRIHGTLEPHSIGTNASSGCIRLINQDAIDLYSRVSEGTKVVVLGHEQPTIGVAKGVTKAKHEG